MGLDLKKTKMRKAMTFKLQQGFSPEDEIFFDKSQEAFANAGLQVRRAKDTEIPTCLVFKTFHKEMQQLFPDTVSNSQLSVTDRGKSPIEVHLCGENWNRIPTHLGSEFTDLSAYRTALISHEFAHVLGHDHVHCACVGCEADVRQQPSRNLHGCKPTTRVILNPKSPKTNDNF